MADLQSIALLQIMNQLAGELTLFCAAHLCPETGFCGRIRLEDNGLEMSAYLPARLSNHFRKLRTTKLRQQPRSLQVPRRSYSTVQTGRSTSVLFGNVHVSTLQTKKSNHQKLLLSLSLSQ